MKDRGKKKVNVVITIIIEYAWICLNKQVKIKKLS